MKPYILKVIVEMVYELCLVVLTFLIHLASLYISYVYTYVRKYIYIPTHTSIYEFKYGIYTDMYKY